MTIAPTCHGVHAMHLVSIHTRQSREAPLALRPPRVADLARASAMRQYRWNDELKTSEHVEFFVRHRNALVATQTRWLCACTVRDAPSRYRDFRFGRAAHFGALSWAAMGLSRRYLVETNGDVDRHASMLADGLYSGELRGLPRGHILRERTLRLFALGQPAHTWRPSRVAWLGSDFWAPQDRRPDLTATSVHLDALAGRWAARTPPVTTKAKSLRLLADKVRKQQGAVEHIAAVASASNRTSCPDSGDASALADSALADSTLADSAPCDDMPRVVDVPLPASPHRPSEAWLYAWHGCSVDAAEAIFRTGQFDMARISTADPGTIGRGFYFALNAAYAVQYATGELGRACEPSACGERVVLLCAVNVGSDTYPVTREEDYTGRSKHPGEGPRCDWWGEPLCGASHVGRVAASSWWQVAAEDEPADSIEVVVDDVNAVVPLACLFIREGKEPM